MADLSTMKSNTQKQIVILCGLKGLNKSRNGNLVPKGIENLVWSNSELFLQETIAET